MKYSEANLGRIFILRLEHNDKLPQSIEEFAIHQKIQSAVVLFIGAANIESKIVAGIDQDETKKYVSNILELVEISEAAGIGTIFMNEQKSPKLHMHSSFGNTDQMLSGCIREGISIWQIGEIVILEMINTDAQRIIDKNTKFEMLNIESGRQL